MRSTRSGMPVPVRHVLRRGRDVVRAVLAVYRAGGDEAFVNGVIEHIENAVTNSATVEAA